MIFWNIVALALRQIARNKARAALTCLGVLIGVAAVVATVHMGEAATRSVTGEIASLGNNLLTIMPGAAQRGPGGLRQSSEPFSDRDLRAVRAEIDGIRAAPGLNASVTAIAEGTNWPTTATGTTADYLPIRSWGLAAGRAFSDSDELSGSRVCLIGATVAKELFDGDALGRSLRLNKLTFTVIGVLAERGQSVGRDQDDVVLVPIKTMQRRITGSDDISSIYVSVDDGAAIDDTKLALEELMRQRRRLAAGAADDFNVRDMREIVEALKSTTGILTLFVSAVAAVSLLVGGIGIMNIMLVSVTERTREIGTRLAVGALARDVLLQFLVEAAMLSLLGGVAGAVLGILGSYLACLRMDMPFAFVPEITIGAFVFSAAVGLLFGYLPARRASRLDPIEALRYE